MLRLGEKENRDVYKRQGHTKDLLKRYEFHSDELVNIVDQTEEQCVEIFQSVTEKDIEREKERAERAEAEFGERCV